MDFPETTLRISSLERGIFAELMSGNIVMCMTGIGNEESDYLRLIEALKTAAASAAPRQRSDLIIRRSWRRD